MKRGLNSLAKLQVFQKSSSYFWRYYWQQTPTKCKEECENLTLKWYESHVIVKWCRDAVNYEKCTCLWKAQDLEGIRTVRNDRIYQRRGCCVRVSTFRYVQFLWVWNQCSAEFVLKKLLKMSKEKSDWTPTPGKFFCKTPTLPILAALKNGSKPTHPDWILYSLKWANFPTGER